MVSPSAVFEFQCRSCWMLFSRYSYRLYRRTDYMLQQKTAQDVMEGEDKIVENMKKSAGEEPPEPRDPIFARTA